MMGGELTHHHHIARLAFRDDRLDRRESLRSNARAVVARNMWQVPRLVNPRQNSETPHVGARLTDGNPAREDGRAIGVNEGDAGVLMPGDFEETVSLRE